jgi:CMP-N-acetylneuraminic acid synthetase
MTIPAGGSNVLLVIPARGGSKRLARKNTALLGGVPMICHTIAAALEAGLADRPFVCTEDEQIARIAEAAGAEVFAIPESMAGDEVSSTVPCLALYEHLRLAGWKADFIFNLQPSSPLRSADDISAALEQLVRCEADFLVSVAPIDPHCFH